MGATGEVQGFPVLAAKGDVRGRGSAVHDATQLFPARVQDPYTPRSTTIDITHGIYLHAVRHTRIVAPQVGEDPVGLLREETIGHQGESPDVATPRVVNIEHALIGGEGQAIGDDEVVNEQSEGT